MTCTIAVSDSLKSLNLYKKGASHYYYQQLTLFLEVPSRSRLVRLTLDSIISSDILTTLRKFAVLEQLTIADNSYNLGMFWIELVRCAIRGNYRMLMIRVQMNPMMLLHRKVRAINTHAVEFKGTIEQVSLVRSRVGWKDSYFG